MENKEAILEKVEQYLQKFPMEEERVRSLIQFITENEEEELTSRKNFKGHITTSAFIINEEATSLLLLKHKSLNRWLQPGGHVDITDPSLIGAALREACEETGLSADCLVPVGSQIFDIDSHHIPANPHKDEPGHVHHDIRFVFQSLNYQPINISLQESTDSKWVLFAELERSPDFYWFEKKISTLISKSF